MPVCIYTYIAALARTGTEVMLTTPVWHIDMDKVLSDTPSADLALLLEIVYSNS